MPAPADETKWSQAPRPDDELDRLLQLLFGDQHEQRPRRADQRQHALGGAA